LSEAVVAGGDRAAGRAAPPQIREAATEAATRAFVNGLDDILVVAAAVAFVGGLLAVVLVRQRDFVTTAGTAQDGSRATPAR
jgi:hypothetical protein